MMEKVRSHLEVLSLDWL